MDKISIRNKVIEWNVRFPYDHKWRVKHNIAFMSLAHKESNFLDQLFELEEDLLYSELYVEDEYKINIGEWVKEDTTPKTNEQLIQEAQEEMNEYSEMLKSKEG